MNQFIPILPATTAWPTASPGRHRFPAAWLLIGLLLLTLGTARADGPDDDYLAAYGLMNEADALNTSGKTGQAHAKYIEAQQALTQFKRDNPGWNPGIVSYRLNYIAGKIADTVAVTAVNGVTNVTTVSPAEPAPPKPLVTLLDAGSEPRTVLRLHPVAGNKQSFIMTMKMGMDMGATGGLSPNMDIPAIVMNVDVEVQSVSAEGEINYAFVYNDVTIAASTNTLPAIAAGMKAALAGIDGMSGTGLMSDRGVIKKFEMKLPATAAPQLSQFTDQMKDSFSGSATPLPDEAVGPGARWEYKSRQKTQNMTVDQTITYKLVSVDGDRLTLRNVISQSAPNQKVQNTVMPGLKSNLTKMSGNGTGSTTLDLGKIMPVSATLEDKTEIAMGMNLGGQQQNMEMKMKINVTIESK